MFEIIITLAMVGWIVKGVVRTVMEADIRKQQMRFAQQPHNPAPMPAASTSEIAQLRAEIAQLRETTTQHALSLQHSFDRLDHRVEFLERKSIDAFDDRHQSTHQVVGR